MSKFVRRRARRRGAIQDRAYSPVREQTLELESVIPLSFFRLLLGEERVEEYLKGNMEYAGDGRVG